MKINEPENQLNLFAYNEIFNSFIKLQNKKKLPNIILLNGPRGSGKATFALHFINYLLSQKESKKYDLSNFCINANNTSYKLLTKNIHPNFFLLKNNPKDENIKIDQVRNLLKFLSKSSYSENLKLILIDNSEYFNLNSSNALLKALEEPNDRTFFFIIHNSSSKILNTIKSRCVEFKIFFNNLQKKQIFINLINHYGLDFNEEFFNNFVYFDSPGNILKYQTIFDELNINYLDDQFTIISHLFEKYKSKKDFDFHSLTSIFIEKFYNDLCLKDPKNSNIHFINKYNTVKSMKDLKTYNLDKKNFLTSLQNIFANEPR